MTMSLRTKVILLQLIGKNEMESSALVGYLQELKSQRDKLEIECHELKLKINKIDSLIEGIETFLGYEKEEFTTNPNFIKKTISTHILEYLTEKPLGAIRKEIANGILERGYITKSPNFGSVSV